MISIETLLRFVAEDAPCGDITTATVTPGVRCAGRILCREEGRAAGLEEAAALFMHYGVTVRQHISDGQEISAGDILMEMDGPAEAILLLERTCLNMISRMSGIATDTARAVAIVRAFSPSVRIAATRKTAPGLRVLDKKAVMLGGGDPHRMTLSDQILIKDNHLALTSIEEAVKKARKRSLYAKIEVEVTSADEGRRAAEAGADILLFDNMTPHMVRDSLGSLEAAGLRKNVIVEISGRISWETLPSYAGLGADVISMGRLTHSPRALDISLGIRPGVRSVRIGE